MGAPMKTLPLTASCAKSSLYPSTLQRTAWWTPVCLVTNQNNNVKYTKF